MFITDQISTPYFCHGFWLIIITTQKEQIIFKYIIIDIQNIINKSFIYKKVSEIFVSLKNIQDRKNVHINKF